MESGRVVQGRDSCVFATGDERGRGRCEFLIYAIRPEPHGRWKHVPCGAGLQPKLAKRLLAHVSVRPAIAVRGGDVSIRHFTLRDFSLLRPQSRADVADVFANVPGPQPHVAWLLSYKPEVLPNIPIVLTDVAALQPAVAVIQPDIAQVLADQPFLQPSVPTVFANIACADVPRFSEVLTYFTGIARFSQIFTYVADLFPRLPSIFPRVAGVQSYVSAMVAIKSCTAAERLEHEPYEHVLDVAIVGLRCWCASLCTV